MSRTHKDIEHAKWYRRPHTKKIISDKARYLQEVKEEFGPNFIRPRDCANNLPVTWDDKHCYAVYKEWTEEKKADAVIRPFINWTHTDDTKSEWFTEMNFSNNTIFVSNKLHGRIHNQPAYYLPFIITTQKSRYYVKVDQSGWRSI